jgi:hypothetical protein
MVLQYFFEIFRDDKNYRSKRSKKFDADAPKIKFYKPKKAKKTETVVEAEQPKAKPVDKRKLSYMQTLRILRPDLNDEQLEQAASAPRPPAVSAFPERVVGSPAHRPFRGLLGVYSRYGLHTRAVTVYRDTLTRGFSHFVTSMTLPRLLPAGAVVAGWDLHPLESAAFARRTPIADEGSGLTAPILDLYHSRHRVKAARDWQSIMPSLRVRRRPPAFCAAPL